jgi:hypothetical protein
VHEIQSIRINAKTTIIRKVEAGEDPSQLAQEKS